jgi:hypothetical protein
MSEQRLLNVEIDKRIVVKLDKSIKKSDDYKGLMTFGNQNDYPQKLEKLVNGSVTAKAIKKINAKFLSGQGFENEVINKIKVGTDARGKEITIRSLLRQVAASAALNEGFYIHANVNVKGEVGNVHLKPFKNCRFSKADDEGYSPKILIYDNWDKQNGKFDTKKIVSFNVFNLNPKVITKEIQSQKGKDFNEKANNYKGQVYFQFFDDEYFYPLSGFDAAYLDCDTENQIALYENRQVRDGFFDSIIIRTAPFGTPEEEKVFTEGIRKQLGPDGDRVVIIQDSVNDEGVIPENGAYIIDKIQGNVNSKLFEGIKIAIKNQIRKSKTVPAILIDYEESKLGNTSGEAVLQATNLYNALTRDDREVIEESFKEIFSNSTNEILRNNTNWKIKELELVKEEEAEAVDQAEIKRLEAQATLKGSVGGVTKLFESAEKVSNGEIPVDNVVNIITEIYGIEESKARKMVDVPIKEEDNGITDTSTTTTD